MILVDSSVWIDWFRGAASAEAERLDQMIGNEDLLVGDLILTEVLQGFGDDRDFATAHGALAQFPLIIISGPDVALAAAHYHRQLRRLGVTVRKTIDTLIAARCLADGLALLSSDRDFDAFATHLGLKRA